LYINTGGSLKGKSFTNLSNIVYNKRYIIFELPNSVMEPSQITVVNICATKGGSAVGILSNKQQVQNVNIYHCLGMVFSRIPTDGNYRDALNMHSELFVKDLSYGMHDYDLRRNRFDELRAHTSYVDNFSYTDNFAKIPDIRYYNEEHQAIGLENIDRAFGGDVFLNNGDYMKIDHYKVILKELIDENTRMIVTNKSNYSNLQTSHAFDMESMECQYNEGLSHSDTIDYLKYMIVGPVTDLKLTLLYNGLEFCYDTIDGLSRIKYITDHKLPNDIYRTQIENNAIETFVTSMDFIKDEFEFNFRLMVKATIGNIAIRIIKYDKHNGGFITKDFTYDIGKFRNEQHFDSIHWIDHIF